MTGSSNGQEKDPLDSKRTRRVATAGQCPSIFPFLLGVPTELNRPIFAVPYVILAKKSTWITYGSRTNTALDKLHELLLIRVW